MTLDAPPTPFSVALRQATWARHEGISQAADPDETTSDETDLLGALLSGDLHLDDYTALHAQQYFVYRLLDEAQEALRDHPVAGRFNFPELGRAAAFEADLALLIGPDWRDRVEPIPATRRYLDRMREVCFDWAGGFIAHHYTRYLGDLSGGQAFRAAANDTYGFADGPGVSFYVFDSIPDATAFKDEYRSRLDSAGFTGDERDRVIAEVLGAYDFNGAVLSELGTRMRRSV
ncbi:heme oxygenase [Stackebrandtia endophytica]|uniref:Heme oxygenase n=1 Tax=Stackebrandtia endophytica TaxID=1496996 RepID=A0A543ATY0_9ACTN|nr:biliverdin-producing heme oxygenase [Stackebrandtia endophytica]TQL76037.1 heme oxygenase [Stackebrandtia endophytica]